MTLLLQTETLTSLSLTILVKAELTCKTCIKIEIT